MVNCVVAKQPQFCVTNFSKNFNRSSISFKGKEEPKREAGHDRFHSELREWKPTLWQRIKHTILPGLDSTVENAQKNTAEVCNKVKEKTIGLYEKAEEAINDSQLLYNKAKIISKNLGIGLIAGAALSIPILGCKLIKQGDITSVAGLLPTTICSSALGGFIGTGGSILYLDGKSNEDIEKLANKYTIINVFKNIPMIWKSSLIGSAVGLIASGGICITNFIKNKSLHFPKNMGLKARILTIAGATIGLFTGIHNIKNN